MGNLLRKEFALAMHPTAFVFLLLSALLLIPNYPYYLTFFYTGLAIFFTCLNGRENHDILYTLMLPIQKREVVKARFLFAVILEMMQMLLAVPFAILRQSYDLPGNMVGMDANIAFFGFSFVMLGIFNFVFFIAYYKNPIKVGISFLMSSTAITIYMLAAETCAHTVPFVRDCLDTSDPEHFSEKILVLVWGIAIYLLLTGIAYRKSIASFEKLDQ